MIWFSVFRIKGFCVFLFSSCMAYLTVMFWMSPWTAVSPTKGFQSIFSVPKLGWWAALPWPMFLDPTVHGHGSSSLVTDVFVGSWNINACMLEMFVVSSFSILGLEGDPRLKDPPHGTSARTGRPRLMPLNTKKHVWLWWHVSAIKPQPTLGFLVFPHLHPSICLY